MATSETETLGVEPPEDESPESPAPSTKSASRRSGGLSIQSKLLAMLLGITVLSTGVVGYLGYRFGSDALRESAFDRLTNVRESRAREVTTFFENIRDSQLIFTRGTTAANAVQEFTEGLDELDDAKLTPKQNEQVDRYYTDLFVPDLQKNSGVDVDPEGFIPTSNAARYLQAHYTDPEQDWGKALAVDDAGDGSAWSRAHAQYHDFFREITTELAYDDALLIDDDGDVVYSAFKAFELGRNVHDDALAESNLEEAFDEVRSTNTIDYVKITDLERYPSNLGAPTGWAVSAIGWRGDIVGYLALQLPMNAVNDVMTGGGDWADEGLGETGETYLVGENGTRMRSNSRFLIEDPEQYREDVIEAGTPPEDADKMVERGGTILLQNVETEATERASKGESGTLIAEEYRGKEALVAYAPLDIPDLDWSIIAKIGTDEAFGPVHDFTRHVILWTVGIILVVSALSLLLAQLFSRPLNRLLEGVRKVAAGKLGTRVDTRSHDEFADLGAAFNDMSASLQTKDELAREQQQENERMLLTMMPAPVAERYRGGEETIAEDHANVSVVYADVDGFDEFVAGRSSDEALALWNEIVLGFDDAAEQHGVDKVRTLRRGYLASCGLVTPHIDHMSRAVDFAMAMGEAIDRFNTQHDAQISLRAGVDAGTVTSGLVGRSRVIYDMWGDAVNLAYRVQAGSGKPGVFVSQQVYTRLVDSTYAFVEAGEVETEHGSEPVWLLRKDSNA